MKRSLELPASSLSTMFRLVMLAALSSLLPACASLTPQSEDFAQRYLDAETGLPIEGVFVSVTWLKDIPRKVGSECVQHAVLRSGPDGWVRQKAPDDPEAYHLFPNLLAPGYEYFVFVVDSVQGDKMKVRHRLDFVERDRDVYPAWAANIERRGYVVNGSYYEKPFVIANYGDESNRPRYLIKRMSFPNLSVSNARTFISGGVCEDSRRNLGKELYDEARRLHRRQVGEFMCDRKWDSAKYIDYDFLGSVATHIGKSEAPDGWARFRREFPDYPIDGAIPSMMLRPFTSEERARLCEVFGVKAEEG